MAKKKTSHKTKYPSNRPGVVGPDWDLINIDRKQLKLPRIPKATQFKGKAAEKMIPVMPAE